jgi:hypothetical protein
MHISWIWPVHVRCWLHMKPLKSAMHRCLASIYYFIRIGNRSRKTPITIGYHFSPADVPITEEGFGLDSKKMSQIKKRKHSFRTWDTSLRNIFYNHWIGSRFFLFRNFISDFQGSWNEARFWWQIGQPHVKFR